MQILCLAFIALSGTNTPPVNVQNIIHSRIKQQWSQHRADVSIEFNESTCPNKGSFQYTDNMIKLQNDNHIWQGRLSIAVEDILAGRKLSFHQVASMGSESFPVAKKKNSKWKKWIPWGIALLGIGSSAWLIHDKNQHIKELQGLKISF